MGGEHNSATWLHTLPVGLQTHDDNHFKTALSVLFLIESFAGASPNPETQNQIWNILWLKHHPWGLAFCTPFLAGLLRDKVLTPAMQSAMKEFILHAPHLAPVMQHYIQDQDSCTAA